MTKSPREFWITPETLFTDETEYFVSIKPMDDGSSIHVREVIPIKGRRIKKMARLKTKQVTQALKDSNPKPKPGKGITHYTRSDINVLKKIKDLKRRLKGES